MAIQHGHRALRRGRVELPGQIYVVTTVTIGRTRFFDDFGIGACAARALSRRDIWLDARLMCWVLMPDHWHGMVELGDDASLATLMLRMKSATARAVNMAMQRSGAVWSRAFHDRAVRGDAGIEEAARYLLANPLRAGLVDDVMAYPFWDAEWVVDDDPV